MPVGWLSRLRNSVNRASFLRRILPAPADNMAATSAAAIFLTIAGIAILTSSPPDGVNYNCDLELHRDFAVFVDFKAEDRKYPSLCEIIAVEFSR